MRPTKRRLKQLIVACQAAENGDNATALASLAEVADTGFAGLAAARIRFAIGDYNGAVALFKAIASSPHRLRALKALAHCTTSLGWHIDALSAWQAIADESPNDLSAIRQMVRLLAVGRAWEEAYQWTLRARSRWADAPDLGLSAVDLLANLGRQEEAAAVLAELVPPLPTDLLARAATVALRAALHEQALVIAGRLDAAGAAAVRGQIALWRMELDEVQACASALLEGRSDSPAGWTLRGAATLLAAAPRTSRIHKDLHAAATAIQCFDHALAADPAYAEALVWRGETLAVLGQDHAALMDLDAGILLQGGFAPAARTLRFILERRNEPIDDHVETDPELPGGPRDGHLGELSDLLLTVGMSMEDVLQSGITAENTERVLGDALVCLGGNRTAAPTRLVGKRLHQVPVRVSPRSAARRALELVRTLPTDQVIAAFDPVLARYPDSPMPLLHRAELFMWLGRYEESMADFMASRAIDRFTRWGFIGPMAVLVATGEPARALEVGDEGVRHFGGAGPSHWVYYGEGLRALGRLEEARETLATAVELNASRVGAHIALAAVCGQLDQRDTQAVEVGWLRRHASPLLSDAAVAIGETWLLGASPTPAVQDAVLDSALSLMRANRSSSCTTWITPEGELRSLERPSDRPPPGADPRPHLIRARALLAAAARAEF